VARTGYIYDERYLDHITGYGAMDKGLAHQMPHPESPARIANAHSLLTSSGLINSLVQIKPRVVERETVEMVHDRTYIDDVIKICQSGGDRIGEFWVTFVCEKSYDIALLAVGGCITGVESILAGDVVNAYALVRPPGHHAERAEGMGYCVFNNIAITAEYLKQKHGLRKILIVDWDVHHGNGTQSIFYEDPSVLYISLHQETNNDYELGAVGEVGAEKGEGFNINIPLPPGTGDNGYTAAMHHIVKTVCEQFKPEFILVSAGQDCSMVDPLSRMSVTYDGFHTLTSGVKELAEKCCEGRLLIVQEGGYHIIYQAYAVVTILETLSGGKSNLTKFYEDYKYLDTNYFKENIQKVILTQGKYWKMELEHGRGTS